MDDKTFQRLLAALVTLAAAALTVWMELPPAQRELLMLQARSKARAVITRLARASGHRAMGRELSGIPEDEAGYERTHWLSRVRDSL